MTRAFWYRLQLLFRFFSRCIQCWKEEKVSGFHIRWIGGLRHDYCFVFGQKLTHKHRCVSWCVIMMQNPWLVFPQLCAFVTKCFAQSAHNFNVVFLIDHTTLWQEFMMHHAIAIEENTEQIWPTFGHPWFVTSYDLFEQILVGVKRRQHLLSNVHATLFLLKILGKSSLPHVSYLKHP